jgi:hypothetical protein
VQHPRVLLGKVRQFIDQWAIRRAGSKPERNPKIIAILTCIGLNLLPTAIGAQPLPGSLQAYAALGQLATGASALGCFMCVFGLVMPPRWRDVGLAVEIGGCVLLAVGFLSYAGALQQSTTAAQSAYAFGASFGIGIGSLLRAGQIALYVRGRRLADKSQPAREIS